MCETSARPRTRRRRIRQRRTATAPAPAEDRINGIGSNRQTTPRTEPTIEPANNQSANSFRSMRVLPQDVSSANAESTAIAMAIGKVVVTKKRLSMVTDSEKKTLA